MQLPADTSVTDVKRGLICRVFGKHRTVTLHPRHEPRQITLPLELHGEPLLRKHLLVLVTVIHRPEQPQDKKAHHRIEQNERPERPVFSETDSPYVCG